MSRFTADWLAQRAAFDTAARSQPAPRAVTRWFCDDLMHNRDGTLRLADLGGGTGTNVQALAPLLPRPQHWTVIDQDGDLLARLLQPSDPTIEVMSRRADLGDLDQLDFAAFNAVAGAAFLDLVSADWIGRLIACCAASRTPLYFALTVDGRIKWTPAHAEDALLHALFCRDQVRDKGLGPARGARAAPFFAERLRRAGARVATAPADWHVSSVEAAMLRAMIDGMANAAAGHATREQVDRLAVWVADRNAALRQRRLALTIGHADVAGLWPRGQGL